MVFTFTDAFIGPIKKLQNFVNRERHRRAARKYLIFIDHTNQVFYFSMLHVQRRIMNIPLENLFYSTNIKARSLLIHVLH